MLMTLKKNIKELSIKYHDKIATIDDNKKKKINNVFFFAYSILTLIINLRHEPWRDEAQSYLLSRLNIIDLFKQLKIEGHPILWYLVLKITNIPYEYLWILPWIITLITSFIIIYKMDKPLINKILILLSAPILYISSSFARSYSLAILFIILIALIYKKRYTHYLLYGILLVLLINTHIIFTGFVCSLILIDIYELIKTKTNRKNKIIIIILFIIGLLLLFLQLFSLFNARSELFSKTIIANKKYYILFVTAIKNITSNRWIGSIFVSFIIFLILALFKEKHKKLLVVLLLSCLSFLGIMAVYFGGYYMHTMILLILVFIYWQVDNKKVFHYIIGILFLCPIIATYKLVAHDIKDYYSSAKMTSEYIKYNISEKEKIYCLIPAACTSLVPYIEKYTLVDIQNNTQFTYTDWRINDHKIEFSIFFNIPAKELPNINYLIIPKALEKKYLDNYEIIYKSPPSDADIEEYIILKRKNLLKEEVKA